MTIINRFVASIAQWARTWSSARSVVAAIESRRTPHAVDMRRLGIEPRAFLSIGHG
jgi:hypothetical protein